jgi:uncharacterized RDD family membrane protein YckC
VVPAEARPLQGRRAGLVSRLAANAVDVALTFALLLASYVGVAFVRLMWQGKEFTLPSPSFVRALLFGHLILIAYFAITWTTSGRTYGDRLMGLRVIDRNHRTMGFAWSLLRAILCAAVPLALLWVAIGRQNRSVQDLILRTSVIYDWQIRASGTEIQTVDDESDDPAGPGVDVQPPVADEADDRHAEPVAGLDRQ